ncbi:MAG TPA: macro domain-containing protein, partial [Holophaga sp.]|nr:macro domain-containing protein [Holophaga sp.]
MSLHDDLAALIALLAPGRPIPPTQDARWRLFRALVNLRAPGPASAAFLDVQDRVLASVIAAKGITRSRELVPVQGRLHLWQGDITTLDVDGIVNAANSALLGCFHPCHDCIDNVIHTHAGVQLRQACAEIMAQQGHPEPVGQAKLTPGFNLPARHVLHTVGPIIDGPLAEEQRRQLASCYHACLDLAESQGLASLAFCCISTGVY